MEAFLEGLKGVAIGGGNSAHDLVMAVAVFIGVLLALKIVQVVILSRLRKLAEKTATDFDDVLIDVFQKVRPPFYVLAALYFGIREITLTGTVSIVVRVAFVVAVVYEVIRALERLLDYVIDTRFIDKDGDGVPDPDRAMVNGMRVVIRAVLWIIGIAAALSNLGVNITSLVASLGIGGIAVALAIQNILGDVFSSFSIYLDKPFQIGDFVVIGADSGTVERIGLKSTRIRTLQGEQLVVSNKELTSVRVQNFKRMERRRVVVTLGVEYGTPAAKLKAIPEWIASIVGGTELCTFDRCHFASYGASTLDFELVFFVDTADYTKYMDVLQEVNLAVYEKFSSEKVEFAFPTRTVHLVK